MYIFTKFLQIVGMLLLVEGLYLGIFKHSMQLEIMCVGLGVGIFYFGRWLEKGKG